MIRNTHRVQKKQWTKWSKMARVVFNRCYEFFINNQRTVNHPKAKKLPLVQWTTVAWNAAWIAADACDDSIPTEFSELR